ncbi:hypothetical protein [Candidatus Brocadia sapporoensis]|uniref:hypothetical protein n=1 Tax=Candidatus Brocadia sapporoensis TaxID=392547 RepID=UPI0015C44EF1|nr:hypothetical protein [Candidatus Brocadia sapporoensis]
MKNEAWRYPNPAIGNQRTWSDEVIHQRKGCVGCVLLHPTNNTGLPGLMLFGYKVAINK